ncbi:hypothetical protein LVJ94_23905 [Pendulispora rubella]|uniref:Lipoprotein n=1 Tax=Pendulispora rubella TaxID=2741070 RepID=A0ABZ2LM85_9BACT
MLSVGCSANLAASSESTDAEASAVTGIVTVERTTGVSGADAPKSDIIARFVRSRAGVVDDDSLRLVGAAMELPAVGSCSRLPAASSATKAARSLELLNVGALSFEFPSGRASGTGAEAQGRPEAKLVARHLPDVVDLVSGVVYTARGEGEAFPAKGRYVFRAAGSPEQEIAPFTVEATAKGEPGDIRIADQSLAHRADGAPVFLPAVDPTEVTWTAEGSADDDVVYIDVSAKTAAAGGSGAGARDAGVRCTFADTGRATLAATAFVADEGTMAIHRVHRESFRARGIDSGVLRFDFARVASYRRR